MWEHTLHYLKGKNEVNYFKDKVSLQPKLEELHPNYYVSTLESDMCPGPAKAEIQ